MSLFADYEPRAEERAGGPRERARVVVRPAAPPDAARLAGLAHERQGGVLGDHEARFRAELGSGADDRLLLVAELAGEVVGFARARRHRPGAGDPANAAPEGWYLLGVIVDPRVRRRGIGLELTRRRLEWIAARAPEAFYFANARNRVSIELHARLGFVELTRDFTFPKTEFEGGVGILFRAALLG